MAARNQAARIESAATKPRPSKPSPAAAIPSEAPGPRALGLDRLIHERTRLAIVSALAAGGTRSFGELKKLLDMTDGNLSVHARKLEDAGYVKCTKTFNKRVPRTEYKLTASGRRALERYLDHMQALIEAARKR